MTTYSPTASLHKSEARSSAGSTLTTLILLIVFLVASFKDEADVVAHDEISFELTYAPLIQYLKVYSIYIIGLLPILIVLHVKLMKYNEAYFVPLMSVPLLLYLYAAIRSVLYDLNYGVRFIAGFLLYLFLYYYIGAVRANYGMRSYTVSLVKALSILSILLISANVYNFLTGGGFIPQSPRFFGSTSHPNFMGVQMAIANTVIFSMLFISEVKYRLVYFVVFLCGLYLLLLTGSRTGLVMCLLGGVVFVISAKNRMNYYAVILAVLGIVSLHIFDVYSIDLNFDVYERGESFNTRAEPWRAMFGAAMENPVFGNGHFPLDSENSYLRAWAAYGIFYLIVMAAVQLYCLTSISMEITNRRADPLRSVIHSLVVCVFVGSILEGYLVDTLSLSGVLAYLLTGAINEVPWRTRGRSRSLLK